MLNRSASLAVSTSVLKALPGKLDIKRHSPSTYSLCLVILVVLTSTLLRSVQIAVDSRYCRGLTLVFLFTTEQMIEHLLEPMPQRSQYGFTRKRPLHILSH